MSLTQKTNTNSSSKFTTVGAYAAMKQGEQLVPHSIPRRSVNKTDVKIQIEYCGVCHSDIHYVRNDWGVSAYPIVPGHEIVGRVLETGEDVSKYKKGDLVGVGCLVDSCRTCSSCKEGLEQYCEGGSSFTYSTPDKHLEGHFTYGGYSKQIVVDEDFVLRVPENLNTQAVAPLLCAGITTYSPLRHWKIKKGDKVGVIGLGGLGHMGVKFAHAMGAHTVVITTSESKAKEAHSLGADEILISTDANAMNAASNQFDFLLNTVPVSHDLNPYMQLLKRDATMVIVGAIEPIKSPIVGGNLVFARKSIAGSLIGGIKETQEMLDFCGKHKIIPDVELIKMDEINTAYERMLKNDVKYRFVIDMASLN